MEKDLNLIKDFPPVSTSDWEKKIIADLKGADYEKKLIWNTYEGIKVKPYYRNEDLAHVGHLDSTPGEFPFVRGYKKDNHWLKAMSISDSPGQGAADSLKYWQSRDIDCFILDAKNISSVAELSKILDAVDLQKTSVYFVNAECYRLQNELLKEYAGRKNISLNTMKGGCLADMFTPYFEKGEKFGDGVADRKKVTSLVKNTIDNFPGFQCISVDSQIFHNAGAHAVQEIAYAVAIGIEYLDFLTDKGFNIDQLASLFRFNFSIDGNYLIQIAKLRAFRWLWSTILSPYQPAGLNSCRSFVHSVSSRYNKSIYDRYTNMLRDTTEAMSAIIGGTDSLELRPFDLGFVKQEDYSQRIANNLHLILANESHFDKVVDPAAGSYLIENLTQELYNASLQLLKTVEKSGGIINWYESGELTGSIRKIQRKREEQVRKRKDKTLGTTDFPDVQEGIFDKITAETLEELAPAKEENPLAIRPAWKAHPFEKLRIRTEKAVMEGKNNPVVFLLPFGNPGMATARQIFSRNFFGCAGFEIIENARFEDKDKAQFAALNNNADIIVLCSSDDAYPDFARDFIPMIKKAKQHLKVFVAGNPVENIDQLKSAGVDGFIHTRSDLIKILEELQRDFNLI